MRKRLLAVAVAGALLVGGSASAHTKGVDDPDDVNSPLDLRRVSLGHDDDSITIMWRTWEPFGSRPFHGRDGKFEIYLQSMDGVVATWVIVDHREGEWVADVHNRDADTWKEMPVLRPFPKIAKIVIPRSEIPDRIQAKLQWIAYSSVDRENKVPLTDYVPSGVAQGHDLTKG